MPTSAPIIDPVEHMGLITSLARRFEYVGRLAGLSFADLVQEGCVAVVRAAPRFRPELGRAVSTFLSKCIWRHLATVLQRAKRGHNTPVSVVGVELDTLTGRDDAHPAATLDRAELTARLLSHLRDRERLAVVLRFGLNGDGRERTLIEIGNILGVSKQRAAGLVEQALQKMHAHRHRYRRP